VTEAHSGPIRRIYTVFNAKQIDGIPNLALKQPTEEEVAESGESILRNSGAQIRHDQRDRAFYSPSEDV
jgi:antirestriction protein ArdC